MKLVSYLGKKMHYILIDTVFSLFFDLGKLVLTILFPIKWFLKTYFYNPMLKKFDKQMALPEFAINIKELQKLSVKQLKARAGLMLFGSLFWFLMAVLPFMIFVYEPAFSSLKLCIVCFIALFMIFLSLLCWLLATQPMYALSTKKDKNSPEQYPLEHFTNAGLDWFFCSKYRYGEYALRSVLMLIIVALVRYFL